MWRRKLVTILQQQSRHSRPPALGDVRFFSSTNFNQSKQHTEHGHPSSSGTPFEVGRLNHVAIAVPNLEQAAQTFKSVLGTRVSAPQALPEHGVTVVFVHLENTTLELLEPLGSESPISKFLAKNPSGGMHHVCLEVPDVKEALRHVTSHTSVRALSAQPKIGAHGTPVVFLHPKDMCGLLTELQEQD